MKNIVASIIGVILISSFCHYAVAQSADLTTIILLRHAEKSTEPAGDPSLTEQGNKRAKELVKLLKHTNIDAIYSTPFNRTRETVQPLADSKSLELKDYNPFKLEEVLEMVKEAPGQTIVFSGHSNTTPLLVNKILGVSTHKQLNEGDYDNLYIITVSEIGKGKLMELQYGEPSEF